MTTQESDLITRLRTAEVTVDDLGRRAKSIKDRVCRIDKSLLSQMPIFAGPWTKDAIQMHLERFKEWVRTPVRAANRSRFENLGITGAAISVDALDDSSSIDQVVQTFEEIVSTCPFLKSFLIQEGCLPVWLSKNITDAKKMLSLIKKGVPGYERLHSTSLLEKHLEELMKKAVHEPEKLASVQETADQIKSIMQYGIIIPESEKIEGLEPVLGVVNNYLLMLESQFPEQLELLKPMLQRQKLAEAEQLLKAKVEECKNKRDNLINDWQRLHKTLCLLGIGKSDDTPPRTISVLQQQITSFQEQCKAKIGEEGMSLLTFLQGDADFPSNLTLDDIRKAFLSLRPFLVISAKNGGQNA